MSPKLARAESEVSKEKFMQDFRVVVTDAEELLRATAGLAGEKVSAARGRIQENLAAAKARLSAAEEAVEEAVVARTKQAARATDEYAHENPWKAVGIGAAVGVIVGMLISHRH